MILPQSRLCEAVAEFTLQLIMIAGSLDSS